MDPKYVLVVGSGSAGLRHARNLADLGCRIACTDPRDDRRKALAAELGATGVFAHLEEALHGASDLDAVVIASPTALHVDQASAALHAGLPVLLEKPVSTEAASGRRLLAAAEETGLPVLLGYTWRWWPPLAVVQQRLREGAIGAVRFVQLHMSAHLADWHPWERYQDFFMASKALGGGALLDESHWIDLMVHFFGVPDRVFARIEKISGLEIETDDNVDMLLDYADTLRVSLHLDLFGRPHEKFIRFVGEEGTLHWSADPNQIALGRAAEQDWEIQRFQCQRNDMFVEVAREFLRVLDGAPVATCTLPEGLQVLEIIDAARRSHAEGRSIAMEPSA